MLDRHEMDGTTDAPEYQEGLVQFYRKHSQSRGVAPGGHSKIMGRLDCLQSDVSYKLRALSLGGRFALFTSPHPMNAT